MTVNVLAGPQALSAIESIRAACIKHDGIDPLDEEASLNLKHSGLEGSDAWVCQDGFAVIRNAALDLAVRPSARNQGIATALLSRATTYDGPTLAWSHGAHPAAQTLAVRFGFEQIRQLLVLRRSADGLPVARDNPREAALRTFRPDDVPQVLAVNRAAFAEHPEQGELDSGGFAARMAEPWFDPRGLIVAEASDGRIVGFHWTKRHNDDHGEVYVLATAPEAQGRGLGLALTLAGLHHLKGIGVKEIHLFVDAGNESARSLYERLGFRHDVGDTHIQFRRSGPHGGPVRTGPQASG